jgi:hypothetical protein
MGGKVMSTPGSVSNSEGMGDAFEMVRKHPGLIKTALRTALYIPMAFVKGMVNRTMVPEEAAKVIEVIEGLRENKPIVKQLIKAANKGPEAMIEVLTNTPGPVVELVKTLASNPEWNLKADDGAMASDDSGRSADEGEGTKPSDVVASSGDGNKPEDVVVSSAVNKGKKSGLMSIFRRKNKSEAEVQADTARKEGHRDMNDFNSGQGRIDMGRFDSGQKAVDPNKFLKSEDIPMQVVTSGISISDDGDAATAMKFAQKHPGLVRMGLKMASRAPKSLVSSVMAKAGVPKEAVAAYNKNPELVRDVLSTVANSQTLADGAAPEPGEGDPAAGSNAAPSSVDGPASSGAIPKEAEMGLDLLRKNPELANTIAASAGVDAKDLMKLADSKDLMKLADSKDLMKLADSKDVDGLLKTASANPDLVKNVLASLGNKKPPPQNDNDNNDDGDDNYGLQQLPAGAPVMPAGVPAIPGGVPVAPGGMPVPNMIGITDKPRGLSDTITSMVGGAASTLVKSPSLAATIIRDLIFIALTVAVLIAVFKYPGVLRPRFRTGNGGEIRKYELEYYNGLIDNMGSAMACRKSLESFPLKSKSVGSGEVQDVMKSLSIKGGDAAFSSGLNTEINTQLLDIQRVSNMCEELASRLADFTKVAEEHAASSQKTSEFFKYVIEREASRNRDVGSFNGRVTARAIAQNAVPLAVYCWQTKRQFETEDAQSVSIDGFTDKLDRGDVQVLFAAAQHVCSGYFALMKGVDALSVDFLAVSSPLFFTRGDLGGYEDAYTEDRTVDVAPAAIEKLITKRIEAACAVLVPLSMDDKNKSINFLDSLYDDGIKVAGATEAQKMAAYLRESGPHDLMARAGMILEGAPMPVTATIELVAARNMMIFKTKCVQISAALSIAWWFRSLDVKVINALAGLHLQIGVADHFFRLPYPETLQVYKAKDITKWWTRRLVAHWSVFGEDISWFWKGQGRVMKNLWPNAEIKAEALQLWVTPFQRFMPEKIRGSWKDPGWDHYLQKALKRYTKKQNGESVPDMDEQEDKDHVPYTGTIEPAPEELEPFLGLNKVKSAFDKVGDTVKDVGDKVKDKAEDLNPINALKGFFEKIVDFFQRIIDFFGGLGGFFRKLVKPFAGIFNFIKEIFKTMAALKNAGFGGVLGFILGFIVWLFMYIAITLLRYTRIITLVYFLGVILTSLLVALLTTILVCVMAFVVFLIILIAMIIDLMFAGNVSYFLRRWFACDRVPNSWYKQPFAHVGNRLTRLTVSGMNCGCMLPCGFGTRPEPAAFGTFRCVPESHGDKVRKFAPAAAIARTFFGEGVSTIDVDSRPYIAEFVDRLPLLKRICRYHAHVSGNVGYDALAWQAFGTEQSEKLRDDALIGRSSSTDISTQLAHKYARMGWVGKYAVIFGGVGIVSTVAILIVMFYAVKMYPHLNILPSWAMKPRMKKR